MKKIRLLAPVLTVGALATAPLTMVSCNSQVTVTFKVDNKVTATQKVDKGSKVMEPKVPTKEGKVFTGWYYKNEKKKEKQFKFTETVDSDLTLEAKFSDATIVSIGITTLPNKISFNLNEDFSYEGIVITALLDDGSTYEVDPSYCEFTGYDKTTEGEQTITVSYDYCETTYKVVVKSAATTTYTVTYKNGGETVGTQTVPRGSTTTPMIPPTVKCQTFKCWRLGSSTTAFDFDNTPITSNTTLNALYENAPQTAISIKTLPTKVSYDIGSSFSKAGLSVYVHYSNGDIATITESSINVTGFDSSTAGIQTLTATYNSLSTTFNVIVSDKTYHYMTFNSMGGTNVDTQLAKEGSSITAPAAPTKDNYTFAGWYTQPDAGTAVTFPYTLNANTVVYAHWTAVKCTITFTDTYDSSTNPVEVNSGTKVSKPADPKHDGKVFKGWYTAATGGSEFDFDEPVTNNQVVYTHYDDAEVVSIALTTLPKKITFNVGDDFSYEEAVVTATLSDGTTKTVTSDCTFTGYVKTSAGVQTITVTHTPSSTTTSYKVVVTAASEDHTITFYLNDGTESSFVETVKDGSKIIEPKSPTRENYEFAGWYTSATVGEGEIYDFDTIPTGDVNLYARWASPAYFNGVSWATVATACEKFEAITSPEVSDALELCRALGVVSPTSVGTTAQAVIEENLINDSSNSVSGTVYLNGKVHTVKCIGAMHDKDEDGNTIALTFELMTAITQADGTRLDTEWGPTGSFFGDSEYLKNLTGLGGGTQTWSKTGESMLFEGTPDLRDRIKTTTREAYDWATTANKDYTTTLFPLTAYEYNQTSTASNWGLEGSPYAYWKSHTGNADRIKYLADGTTTAAVWTATRSINYNYFCVSLTKSGSLNSADAGGNDEGAYFAFCL